MISATSTYIFLEYCSAGDLRHFIPYFNQLNGSESRILNEDDAREVTRQLLEGMRYLGRHNIMHRDLKLDNIMVNQLEGTSGTRIEHYSFKLGDMGLAKSLNSKTQLAETFAGTPLTMAPEVVDKRRYDYKADVWSLGTILFQMLTSEYPFTGKNMQELKLNLEKGVYRIPRHINLTVECMQFLTQCLKVDSLKRKDWEELV